MSLLRPTLYLSRRIGLPLQSVHLLHYANQHADASGCKDSTLTSKTDTSQGPAPTLWKNAFDKLSHNDKESLPFTGDDRRNYLEKVLERTVESRDACREKGLKFKFGEKTFVVRDLAEKIMSWVEKFKEIGDVAVQYDPVHAALPWVGIRLLLQACLTPIERQVGSANNGLAGIDRQREYESGCFRC